MEWLIDMEQKVCKLIEYGTYVVTFNIHLTHDLDLGFSRSNFEKLISQEWDADWHGSKGMWVNRMLDPCDFHLWSHPWHWPWIFKVKYWNCCTSGIVGSTHLEWKGCELDYDVGCTMELTLGHGAWQIDWPSNGSMWNSYSFQPVGPWMGYSFTDRGAEGCCRFLIALLPLSSQI